MVENLSTTKYNDGTSILLATGNTWNSLTSAAYCWNNNDSISHASKYGALYNWHAIETNKLCPIGWHVPSIEEWSTLIDFLGGGEAAAIKMLDTITWTYSGIDQTNESGFSAPAGGRRMNYNNFVSVGNECFFWSSSESDGVHDYAAAVIVQPFSYFKYLGSGWGKMYGMSVRCVGDLSVGAIEKSTIESLSIYPNPVENKLIIDKGNLDDVEILIYSSCGELIRSNNLIDQKSEIDVSALKSGLYIINIVSIKETKNLKLIKE